MSYKDYLGDSVYADFDGYHIVLTTENGYADDPRNRIALEPQVIAALDRYVERLRELIKEQQLCRDRNAESSGEVRLVTPSSGDKPQVSAA